MYAVGHLALGYLTGKAASKVLNVKVTMPLLFLASVLPDIDLLIPGLEHRGPTHSLIVVFLVSLPALTLFRKKAVPYLLALVQHSIVGDFLTGRAQLLWPVIAKSFGVRIGMTEPVNILLEWTLFFMSLYTMGKTGDARVLFQPHPSNLLLSVPVFTVLLPAFFSFPLRVPLELFVPHLAYTAIFVLSILKDLKSVLASQKKPTANQ